MIQGNTATAEKENLHVFYDTEVIAVVHRFKEKSSGLAKTELWGWKGGKCQCSEKEEKKLQDLAKRYNTQPVSIVPHSK